MLFTSVQLFRCNRVDVDEITADCGLNGLSGA